MESLQGNLLVASAQLLDPNFSQTVLLVVEHNDDGALGLILNRPTVTTIDQAWKQVSNTPCPRDESLHHGGPCEGPLMVVHGYDAAAQIEVKAGIYFSAEQDDLETMVATDDVPVKFFVGCAGWASGQLEQEMKTGSWLTASANAEHVFCESDDQWSQVTKEIARQMFYPNLDPRLIPKDPSMN